MINKEKMRIILVGIFLPLVMLMSENMAVAEVVYTYNFEDGMGDWSSDNGIWDVGEPVPDVGPGSAYSLPNCAGTVLGGNYPNGPNSRLISPTIVLPEIGPDEEIVLRFWDWFSYAIEEYDDDAGYVQIRVYENDVWSAWESIETQALYSKVWSPHQEDLSGYAGKYIQIGFYHVDRSDFFGHHESSGWYVDDITIKRQTVCQFATDVLKGFESGWGCWWSSNGVWEIGEPTSGPGSAYSGLNSAGTVLDGNYPQYTDSYLVSPPIELPTVTFPDEILLRFQQWFSYATEQYDDDVGEVRIQIYEDGAWSSWISLKTVSSYITDWHHERIVLNDYAGKRVRIAFVHIDRSDFFGHHENSGWYIDELIIETPIPPVHPPQFKISPPSGYYLGTQHFGLALLLEASDLTVDDISATMNGIDVTTQLNDCLIPGTLLTDGESFRCPEVSEMLNIGRYTLSVTIELSDGSDVSDTAIWNILSNTEP